MMHRIAMSEIISLQMLLIQIEYDFGALVYPLTIIGRFNFQTMVKQELYKSKYKN